MRPARAINTYSVLFYIVAVISPIRSSIFNLTVEYYEKLITAEIDRANTIVLPQDSSQYKPTTSSLKGLYHEISYTSYTFLENNCLRRIKGLVLLLMVGLLLKRRYF